MKRSEINLVNTAAYDALAPFYRDNTGFPGGWYPDVTQIQLDNGRQKSFFIIDACEYRFEMAMVDFLVKTNSCAPFNMLDIGFGAGYTLRDFANNSYETVGVDLSTKMCELARTISPKSKIIRGDIFYNDFPDGHFNAIVMMSMLCQLPTDDARELLMRVKKWLNPDTGYIYASTSVEQDDQSGVFIKDTLGLSDIRGQAIPRFRTNYTISRFIELIESAGFDVLMPFIISEKDHKSNRQFQGYICRPRR